jgi:7-cyano-7-deazaguanine synthase in queuosine biosynthesis
MSVVVLNSGGFDSVVLINHVRHMFPEEEINSLFFDYGQNSSCEERKCSFDSSRKVKATWREIKLPKMIWTKSGFYDREEIDVNNNYLEYRNMIFLSYAVSYARSIKDCFEVYTAMFREDNPYEDTSQEFIDGLNYAIEGSGIKVLTPLRGGYKTELAPLAKYYGIKIGDFHSCDKSDTVGEPCGKCGDCLAIKEIYEDIESHDIKY